MVPTGYKERFDDNVADHRRPVDVDETRVERDDDRHVERREQYQPVPARLEAAVVAQDKLRFFDPGRFVFRQWCRG